MIAVVLLLACASGGSPLVRGQPGDADTAPDTDTSGVDASTVPVSHPRELRGLYVATVYSIDWPSSATSGAASQRAEITSILDLASAARLNAVFLQVRPEGDALYASSIEPWSRWTSGTQGVDPGYDPLEDWVREAHARGIEVHAWLNPYRARVGSTATSGLAEGHMALAFPRHAHAYNGNLWMDPGSTEVRARVIAVVTDVVTRYDVDGVHIDDYFYPYPDDTEFPDAATWDPYVAGGGTLSRDDWRRSNTAALVRDMAAAVRAHDPALRFGVAPFGIWRPGTPSGTTGLDAYGVLYADPLAWIAEGTVDYLAPQLYWETTNAGQEFGLLAPWWDAQLADGQDHFPALNLSAIGTDDFTLAEYAAELAIARGLPRTRGQIWYSASPLIDDVAGLRATFPTWYSAPALPPTAPGARDRAEPAPTVTFADGVASWVAREGRRAITVYRSEGDAWTLDRIVPASAGAVTLGEGRWALASVGVGGVESAGVVVP